MTAHRDVPAEAENRGKGGFQAAVWEGCAAPATPLRRPPWLWPPPRGEIESSEAPHPWDLSCSVHLVAYINKLQRALLVREAGG